MLRVPFAANEDSVWLGAQPSPTVGDVLDDAEVLASIGV